MLQIDHIYEFFYNSIFKDFDVHAFDKGVPTESSYMVFNKITGPHKILFYDQEPLIPTISPIYMDYFNIPFGNIEKNRNSYPALYKNILEGEQLDDYIKWYKTFVQKPFIVVNSEHSEYKDLLLNEYGFKDLYYFYHGFAALDWYRGYCVLNHNKTVVKEYKHDYQSFNRIVTGDRAYRKTFVDSLRQEDLLKHGAVSYGVTDDPVTEERLVIDHEQLPGSASADIPRGIDAFWHIVTETVFYYDKLHLTEKIFKPIVSKQPFMLLAAPGNLAYLKSYGFKTFDSVIDESYDLIQDDNERIDSVVAQMKWYCNLSQEEKSRVIERLAPILEYNFQHFYGDFKHIIANELLTNCQTLFEDVSYNDSHINYFNLNRLLTT
jgi:hypothetical protein